jgi:hypothetical protein
VTPPVTPPTPTLRKPLVPIAWDLDTSTKKIHTKYSDYVPFAGYDFRTFDQTPFQNIAYPTQPSYWPTQPFPATAPAASTQPGVLNQPATAQQAPAVQNLYGLDGFQVFDQNAPQVSPAKKAPNIEDVYYVFNNPYGE